MGYGQLIHSLKLHGVINSNDTLNVKFAAKLRKFPRLLLAITESTSFLQYSAPVKVRIHCLIQGVTCQPTCVVCHTNLKMRTTGRFVNTFPTTCSISCTNHREDIIKKRKQTNLTRYGSEYVLQANSVRERISNTIQERYGVKSVLSIPAVQQKRQETLKRKLGESGT